MKSSFASCGTTPRSIIRAHTRIGFRSRGRASHYISRPDCHEVSEMFRKRRAGGVSLLVAPSFLSPFCWRRFFLWLFFFGLYLCTEDLPFVDRKLRFHAAGRSRTSSDPTDAPSIPSNRLSCLAGMAETQRVPTSGTNCREFTESDTV